MPLGAFRLNTLAKSLFKEIIPDLPGVFEAYGWGNNQQSQTTNASEVTTFVNIEDSYSDVTDVKEITAGTVATFIIKNNGTLFGWGRLRELAQGSTLTTEFKFPVQIGTDTNWNKITAGSEHAIALKTTGTLWAWGVNTNGVTGLNTASGTTTTVTQIGTDTNWAQVSAGFIHSMAIKTTGTLWAWGSNASGRTGLNTTTGSTNIPTQIGTDTDWAFVTAGSDYTLAIKTNGTLWGWGSNQGGKLGDGTTTQRLVPTQIGTDTDWAVVNAGFLHTLGIKTNGTLWAWGTNGSGRLGDGTITNRSVPTQIGTDTNWSQVSAGNTSSLAIKTNGTLWGTGENLNGELGRGDFSSSTSFIQSGTDSNWRSVEMKIFTGFVNIDINRHRALAIKTNDTAYGAGSSAWGEFVQAFYTEPTKIPSFNFNNISASGNSSGTTASSHGIATATNRKLYGWGRNGNRQTGVSRSDLVIGNPTQNTNKINWAQVSAGTLHSLAVANDGTLWTWGSNTNGRTGLTTTFGSTSVPTQIGTDTDWAQVSAGDAHTLAIKTNGTLWAWGNNASSRLGDGTTTGRVVPTQIGTDTDWAQVSAGLQHSGAIKTNGTLWMWGSNLNGRTGFNLTTGSTTVPTQVGTDTNWAQVSLANTHSMAIKTTGTLWAWGANTNGRLGDGTTTQRNVPTQIGSDTNWSQVSAGNNHTVAIKTTGTLWAWGDNQFYTLGDGTLTQRLVPTQLGSGTKWIKVSAGRDFNFAILDTEL
jgi:alpha-tubulin suppressor-like RCC1 family protein